MSRPIALAILAITLASGCRHYDSYSPLANQKGLIPSTRWGRYGQEQTVAIAIGRVFGSAYESSDADAWGRQMAHAVQYAQSQGVEIVRADTLGHRLTVRFPSGWRLAILPIDDGMPGDDTPGPSAAGQ
ncbi:MAG: hypothetical protein V3T16_03710 [Gemmatimonadales bacterium]